MKAFALVVVLVLCLAAVIGVPIASWVFLVPVGFWQKVALLAGIAIWESVAIPLSFVFFGGSAAVLYGD